MFILRYVTFFLLLTIFSVVSFAQDTTEVEIPESKEILKDSVISSEIDSVQLQVAPKSRLETPGGNNDTITSTSQQGDIETTVNYYAEDSINFSIDGRIVYLYGNARIDYGEIQLEAAQVIVDWEENTLTATGQKDSTGKIIGRPVFTDGPDTYETNDIKYNFKTKKAYIKGVVTQQGEGFMHGSEVKRTDEDELYIKSAKYTTCNLADPHYHIEAKKLKVIPGDKVLAGPFNLAINEVPTPLGFPFGMFPSTKERTSGVLFPTYGEERNRGFFLRNGGYFWAISDYINFGVTGDIYSKGSFGLHGASTYRKRYQYNGSFRLDVTSNSSTREGVDTKSNDFRISWSHAPQNFGSSRFSVSVNAATSTFNQNNALDVQNNIRTTLNSNISYSKLFTGSPFSLGLSGGFTQNLRTKEVNLTLPNLTFNMQNINPFLKKGQSPDNWIEKIVLRYSLSGRNQINNRVSSDSIAPFDLNTIPELLKDSRKGFQHTIPVSTSFRVFNYFTLTPSLNYTERWYFERLNYSYDSLNNGVVQDTSSGFYRVYDYGVSAGLSTRFYGTVFFNNNKIKAIRHQVNPSISFSYRPDFSDPDLGFFQEVQVNESGDTELRNRFRGGIFGAPGQGRSGSIGFGVNNNLEMKIKTKKDTVEGKFTKITLLNNFRISTAYNIFSDNFNLSNITFNANASLLKRKFNITVNGRIDPYIYELTAPITFNAQGEKVVKQRRVDRFAWNSGQGIGQLTTLGFTFNTSLNPETFSSGEKIKKSNIPDHEKDFLLHNPDLYVDFNVPWNLRLNYRLTRNVRGFEDPEIIQSSTFSGDLRVTPKTMITFSSGYDFKRKELTRTSINITRNLHCWEMLFHWIPFGNFQSFEFTIRVKSSLLQDLQLNRRRSFFDLR